MTASKTTLSVEFVSESTSHESTFGWYDKVSGVGGILFAKVESAGRHGLDTGDHAEFTVDAVDVGNIEYFLIPNGGDLRANTDSELSRPIKVVQSSDGTWAVATLDSNSHVETRGGDPNILVGVGANAFFTEAAKNERGVDHASSIVGGNQTAAALAGDTADGALGQIAWEDLAATQKWNGTWTAPGDADYNDAVFRVSIRNDRPDARSDSVTVGEDGGAATIDVLANDNDRDGDAIEVSSIEANGTLGTVSIAPGGSGVIFTPGAAYQYLAAGERRTETISYTITDENGATDTGILKVNVVGANDGPIVVDAHLDGAVAERPDGSWLENRGSLGTSGTVAFTDADSRDRHTVSVLPQGSDYRGTLVVHVSDGGDRDPSHQVNWSYSVAASSLDNLAAGETLTQLYALKLSDREGGIVTRTVAITLTGTNDAPVITSAFSQGRVAEARDGSSDDNTAVHTSTGHIRFDDVDLIDTHTVTVTPNGGDYRGTLTAWIGNPSTGDGEGTVTWLFSVNDADLNDLGAHQRLTQTYVVRVGDGNGGYDEQAVSIRIEGAADSNVPPVITSAPQAGAVTEIADGAPSENTVTHSTAGTITLSDDDVMDAHTASFVEQAGGYRGTFTLGQAGNSVDWTFSVADSALDDLAVGQILTQRYDVAVSDGHGGSATQTVTVTADGANDAPQAQDDTADATEAGGAGNSVPGTNPSGNVLINDNDVDGTDSKQVGAVNGSAENVGVAVAGLYGTLTLDEFGHYTYTLDNDNAAVQALRTAFDTLSDSFSYTIHDFAGETSTASLTVTIHGANDAPVALLLTDFGFAQEAGGIDNGTPGYNATGNVLTNDTDPDGAAYGETKTVTTTGTFTGSFGTLTLNADGSYVYVVDQDRADSLQGDDLGDSFQYTMADASGATSWSSLRIAVLGANDTPQAQDDTADATEAGGDVNSIAGTNPSGNVLINDNDVDGTDTKQVGAVNGSAENVGVAVAGLYGTLTLDEFGHYTYTLDNDNAAVQALRTASDTLSDSFSYTMHDLAGATSTASLTVTMHGANDAPQAQDDTADATEAGGELSVSGTNPSGHVLINSVPGTNPSGNVLINDSDLDGTDTKQVAAVNGSVEDVGVAVAGLYGTLTLDKFGEYTYTLNNDKAAVQALRTASDTLSDSFSYTMHDFAGETSTASLTVTIHGENDAPVARPDVRSAQEAGGIDNGTPGYNATGNVLTNDSDPDGAAYGETRTITTTGTFTGRLGALTLHADGSYVYMVDQDRADSLRTLATDPFEYTIVDASGATSSAFLYISVLGANDAPVAQEDNNAGDAVIEAGGVLMGDPSAAGNVLANDTDPDAFASWTVQGVSAGSVEGPVVTGIGAPIAGIYGSVTIAANGTWIYTLDNADADTNALAQSQSVSDTFTYTMHDAAGATSTATLTIAIMGTAEVSVVEPTALTLSHGFITQSDAALDNAGQSVASAGDVNGDGFADLIVGAPQGGDAGEAYVVFGGASGASNTAVTTTGTAAAETFMGGLATTR
jgi:VCBS repeat-containing protein